MFSSLFSTKKVDVGGGITALVAVEPTMSRVAAYMRAADSFGDLDGFSDAGMNIAFLVEGWVGIPDEDLSESWPDLDAEGGVETRMKTIATLPKSAFEGLAKACLASIKPTENEAKNSESPPE